MISAPPILESPKKRMRWLNKSMEVTMKAVYNGCSIKRAALERNILRTTLQDQITGNVERGSKPSAKPNSNKAEGTELADFLEVVAEIRRLWKTQKQIMGIVELAVHDIEKLTKEKILRKQKISAIC